MVRSDADAMDAGMSSEWRQLEDGIAGIGTFLESLAERVAEWGRDLETKTHALRADISALTGPRA